MAAQRTSAAQSRNRRISYARSRGKHAPAPEQFFSLKLAVTAQLAYATISHVVAAHMSPHVSQFSQLLLSTLVPHPDFGLGLRLRGPCTTVRILRAPPTPATLVRTSCSRVQSTIAGANEFYRHALVSVAFKCYLGVSTSDKLGCRMRRSRTKSLLFSSDTQCRSDHTRIPQIGAGFSSHSQSDMRHHVGSSGA
jgi:hypothetical protein